jgi:NDP-4-keto-2,6-dideoxyhexose 3-C-methyltransferase
MRSNFKKITACRICGNKNLVKILDLGNQYLTGVFPRAVSEDLVGGPLSIVKCHSDVDACGLLQLEHSYEPEEMYGGNYGYRSGLNPSMVEHLHGKIRKVINRANLKCGDLIIDIGSNDGTTLSAYPPNLELVGIDPIGEKFRRYYEPHIKLISEFFSAHSIESRFPGRKASVVTSFSMFYDLESPTAFACEVAKILDPETGFWVFEQSYLPSMLETVGFDTICHEHLEYYGMGQISWIADRAGLKIIDVELNEVNGGSFSVVVGLKDAVYKQNEQVVQGLLNKERELELSSFKPYLAFAERIDVVCRDLQEFIKSAKKAGKRICALGASTKGNVLLQYCGLGPHDIDVIGEVNEDKFGSFTPGSWIPIADELSVLASRPDYLIVLPWHFKNYFLKNPALKGQCLVFPLPSLDIVYL